MVSTLMREDMLFKSAGRCAVAGLLAENEALGTTLGIRDGGRLLFWFAPTLGARPRVDRDELDRILPYAMALLEDDVVAVRIAALRTITQLVCPIHTSLHYISDDNSCPWLPSYHP